MAFGAPGTRLVPAGIAFPSDADKASEHRDPAAGCHVIVASWSLNGPAESHCPFSYLPTSFAIPLMYRLLMTPGRSSDTLRRP